MSLNKYLDVAPEAAEAIRSGKPVVALESAGISIIGGRLKAGLCALEQ